MTNICFSGGAKGSDLFFGEQAAKAGHQVIHYSFKGHSTKAPKETLCVLNEKALQTVDAELKLVAKLIDRSFPTRIHNVNNLLRRNFFQVAAARSVYAVSTIGDDTMVAGGTAWAIMMAIRNYIEDIFLFDQIKEKWFQTNLYIQNIHPKASTIIEWKEIENPSKPQGFYAGIGTRELNEAGKEAIKSLYI